MIMKTKNVLLGMAAVCGCAFQAIACTGIALTAADGSYVQSRTIEWARGVLQSEYVVIPRGQRLRSFTPSGADGMVFTSKYGVVGLAVVQKEFIAEGINEAGLSAGLFFFPQYGGYEQYDPAQSDRTLADLQLVAWILTQFSTIDQVKAAIASVRRTGALVGRALAYRRAFRTAGGAGNRRRGAAFLRERSRRTHQCPRFRVAAHQSEQLCEPLSR